MKKKRGSMFGFENLIYIIIGVLVLAMVIGGIYLGMTGNLTDIWEAIKNIFKFGRR